MTRRRPRQQLCAAAGETIPHSMEFVPCVPIVSSGCGKLEERGRTRLEERSLGEVSASKFVAGREGGTCAGPRQASQAQIRRKIWRNDTARLGAIESLS